MQMVHRRSHSQSNQSSSAPLLCSHVVYSQHSGTGETQSFFPPLLYPLNLVDFIFGGYFLSQTSMMFSSLNYLKSHFQVHFPLPVPLCIKLTGTKLYCNCAKKNVIFVTNYSSDLLLMCDNYVFPLDVKLALSSW